MADFTDSGLEEQIGAGSVERRRSARGTGNSRALSSNQESRLVERHSSMQAPDGGVVVLNPRALVDFW